MPVIRLFLLLVVLGGLTLLLGQNWSPVLPLVFLGAKTQALPLAIWILLSVAAGAVTSLFITGLFKLANYFTRSSSSRRKAPPPPRSSAQRQVRYAAASRPATKPDPGSTPSNPANDWISDSTTNDDDWGFEEDTDKTRSNSPNDVTKTNDFSSAPKSNYQADSYSYSYQEPSNSGVGKTESVYDADYRVIKPPYSQPDTAENDEDGGFSAQSSAAPNTAASRSSKPDIDSTPSNGTDDWDSDSNNDDWDFEEDSKETPFSSDTVRNPNYEVNNEPKSGYRAGSVYSYSYREAKNSDLGSESVSDADRVSTPLDPPDSAQDEDDWGFEDEDDFGDEGDRDSDIKRR